MRRSPNPNFLHWRERWRELGKGGGWGKALCAAGGDEEGYPSRPAAAHPRLPPWPCGEGLLRKGVQGGEAQLREGSWEALGDRRTGGEVPQAFRASAKELKRLTTAMAEYNSGLYFSTVSPRLEDAGLEDSALPVESIKEAFDLASRAVRAVAEGTIGIPVNPEGPEPVDGLEEAGRDGCVVSPQPDFDLGDDVRDLDEIKVLESGSCVETKAGGLLEEGKDKVVDEVQPVVEDALVKGEEPGPKLGGGTSVDVGLAI